MSTQYNIEPQPTAKVLLTTTAGDILIELFAKQTPLTSRNFLQLCLDGYYDGTIFHRVVPGFVVQGGDPTGTGNGGDSSFENGAPFADEFHSRLRFNRRGLLGMANSGTKDDNQSQFFFTLAPTPELTGKNTMFGRIVGDTVFNVLKMAETDMVEGSDKPLYPEKILKTEILVNPFDDMVKRELKKQAEPVPEKKEEPVQKATVRKGKAKRTLLSFATDEPAESRTPEPETKKPKYNEEFVSAGRERLRMTYDTAQSSASESKKDKPPPTAQQPRHPSPSPPPAAASRSARKPSPSLRRSPSLEYNSDESEPDRSKTAKEAAAKANAEYKALKDSMRRNGSDVAVKKPEKKSALESMIPSTSTRGRRRNRGTSTAEEQRSLDLLAAFKARLDSAPEEEIQPSANLVSLSPEPEAASKVNGTSTSKTEEDEDIEATLCDLHFIPNCQSCSKWDQVAVQEDEDVEEGWMNHRLTFEKDRLGKDLEWKRKNEEELVVIDPRSKEKELGVKRRDREGDRRDRRTGGGRIDRDRRR